MAGKLLILSFHNDKPSPTGEETKLDEDLLFKRSALASPPAGEVLWVVNEQGEVGPGEPI